MLYNRCEEIALQKEEGEEKMGGAETQSIIEYKEEKLITWTSQGR
jgi:hypothetical protein